MADASARSVPHQRTRRDHASETAEDYVEAIAEIVRERETCRVTDLARHFAVSHVTVNRIIKRLHNLGLLAAEPYQPITLTAKGKRLAAKCQERHETVYAFLLAIGIDRATAAMDAEGMEHHLSPATLRRFREMTERLNGHRQE